VTHEKVRIDQATLTFAELGDIEDELGASLSALFEKGQARAMAAIVWVTVRRNDPTFTYQQALQYGPADIENTEDADPEAPSANDGAPPLKLHASGGSAPST
jgi:hypothetical protein